MPDDISATIVKEVEGKIQAAVLNALAGDEVIGAYVRAALMAPVNVGYGRDDRGPYLTKMIFEAIQTATQVAVVKALTERAAEIEAAVAEALTARSGEIANQLITSLTAAAGKPWGLRIELSAPELPDDDDDDNDNN